MPKAETVLSTETNSFEARKTEASRALPDATSGGELEEYGIFNMPQLAKNANYCKHNIPKKPSRQENWYTVYHVISVKR
jgi:hypothetical protein